MSEKKFGNINPEDMEVEDKAPKTVREKKFDEKNYLNVKLKEGEDSKTLRIRLLPIEENGTPWKIIYMHTVKVPNEISKNGWKSYVCLKKTDEIDHNHFGDKCPFCEMNHLAYVEMTKAISDVERERWKKISLENNAKPVCVCRCIERGKEDEGPKFWKFTVRDDGKDPKNVITELYKSRRDDSIEDAKLENNGTLPEDFVPTNIMDVFEGRDLKVTINRVYDKEGRPTNKTSISIVDYEKSRPLGTEEQIEKWLTDSKKWSDVFVVKPYDYLDVIVNGEIPFYSKPKGKWVAKSTVDKENDIVENDRQEADKKATEEIKKAEEEAANASEYCEESEDDLPF